MAMTLWYTPHHIISRNTIPFGMAWLSFYLKATLRQGSLIHQLYLYRLNVECFIQVWLSYYGNDDVDDDEYNAMGLMAILWCDWTNLIFLFVALPMSIPSNYIPCIKSLAVWIATIVENRSQLADELWNWIVFDWYFCGCGVAKEALQANAYLRNEIWAIWLLWLYSERWWALQSTGCECN